MKNKHQGFKIQHAVCHTFLKITLPYQAKRRHGFTLIELIVVIVILGVLAATAMPKFINMRREARLAALKGLEGGLRTAVETSIAAYRVVSAEEPTGCPSTVACQGLGQLRMSPRSTWIHVPFAGKTGEKAAGIPLHNYNGIGVLMGTSPTMTPFQNVSSTFYSTAQGFTVVGEHGNTNDAYMLRTQGLYWFPPGISVDSMKLTSSFYTNYGNGNSFDDWSIEGDEKRVLRDAKAVSPQCFLLYHTSNGKSTTSNTPAYHIVSFTDGC